MPYCRECGAEVSKDDVYCPSCGAALGKKVTERHDQGEKDEKDEKMEKREKEEEKHEKGEHDRSGPIVGGMIIILLGSILLLTDAGIISGNDSWSLFLAGIGGILLFQGAYKYAQGMRGGSMGYLIGGVILCGIGVGNVLDLEHWWAVVLIIIGAGIIIWGYSSAKKSPKPR